MANPVEELIEEMDWNGRLVAIVPKSELRKRMFPHRVALVIPRGDEGFILARRGLSMEPFPDTWVCAIGGKVLAGESYEDAARREASEEAGLEIRPIFVSAFLHNDSSYQGLFQVFTTPPLSVSVFRPDSREVQYFRDLRLAAIEEMVRAAPESFAPTFLTALRAFVQVLAQSP